MLTLYYARNTCARATHIALLDAGAEFSTVRIDTTSNQQNSPEYLAVNPKGRVPALATENGVLTETPLFWPTSRSVSPARASTAQSPVRLRSLAGVQPLSLRDVPYRARASVASAKMGHRSGDDGRIETGGPRRDRILLVPYRRKCLPWPLGHG